jgi:hypothetical protein
MSNVINLQNKKDDDIKIGLAKLDDVLFYFMSIKSNNKADIMANQIYQAVLFGEQLVADTI